MKIQHILKELWNHGSFSALMVGMISSIIAGFIADKYTRMERPSGDLTVQIQQVSSALADVTRITESLKTLKDDLKKTEAERARIEADYKRASELKTLTEEQFTSIRAALTKRTIWQVISDNLIAFMLGVVSSLSATGIWFYFSQKRMEPPNKGIKTNIESKIC